MSNITLPDEIIRKIYQYILPIFDYEKYIIALREHDNLWYTRKLLIHASKRMINSNIKYNYNTQIHDISIMMNSKLKIIQNFIKKNPMFKRPFMHEDLNYGQYKIAWEYEYNKNRIPLLEANIMKYRTVRCLDKCSEEFNILKYQDINNWFRNCTIKDVEYACTQNNIPFNSLKNKKKLNKNISNLHYKNMLIRFLIEL